ncbi:MAG: PKD domain-containing protein [Flavobacteriales bacterium]|nr:PKD domain-containing protein [Flavobacteriales bacterium]
MKKLLLTASAALTILFAQAQQCQADFSYMQNGPTTIFTDLSTVNPSWSTNYSVTWDWDFGDGTPVSHQQNPVHTYANNGIYTPCLTVTYFDSTIINWCTSVYCDSILIGNSIPASWDCNPATGCYDPGTGLGQYTSLSACQAVCGTPTPSWDCPVNTPGGCYDPGTGNGQYTSLAACQAVCGIPTPSWDCNSTGCYDPGTGMGQYTTLAACQAICVSTVSNACDSMTLVSTGGSPQTILMAEVPISFMDIHYWITTAPDGTVLGEDSLWNSHQIFNNMNNGQPYDTLNICITYIDNNTFNTCCVIWIWDANLGVWAKMGSVTSIGEIDLFDKKLIKVVDVLGRETSINSNQTLFFIYEDGTIEKRYIIDRK